MRCGKCGAEIQDGAAFCPSCGAKIELGNKVCVSCNKEIPASSTFCPYCGATQDGKKAKKKKKKWPFIVIGIILALVLLIALIPAEDTGDTDNTGSLKTPTETEEPVATPEPTPDRYVLRDDGQIDTYLDDDGNTWEYFYNDDGIYKYRVKTIEYPEWAYSEEAKEFSGFTVHPCEFSEDIENCIGFDIEYAITHVDYGSVYGDYVVYVLEPEVSETKFQDEGRITVKEDETATKTVELKQPRTVRSLALRQYIPYAGGSSWSSYLQIRNLKIIDYDYNP